PLDCSICAIRRNLLPNRTSDLAFTSQNQDTVSGDYDFLYREYSNQGRWPSPDPGGATAVILENPQSWNRYACVLNNPPRFTDPLGLWCVWQDGTHDDAENNGGVGPTAWLNDGGLWDDTNSLTGLRLKLELHGQECYRSKAAL